MGISQLFCSAGEFLEVVKLEGHSAMHHTVLFRDSSLLQLCSGIEEGTIGACAQLVFAPMDGVVSEDIPLLPSGFCVIPVDNNVVDGIGLNCTLHLASTLEGGHDVGLRGETKSNTSFGQVRSVLTIAFQFAYEVHTRETCATMARQYVRTVVASVQRVTMALAPSHFQPRQAPGNSDAISLARHILSSYRAHLGMDLVRPKVGGNEALFEVFWHHTNAIVCCAWKGMPKFVFANRAALEMFEGTSGSLQDLAWDKTLDEGGLNICYATFTQVLQQGKACIRLKIKFYFVICCRIRQF